MPSQKKKNTHRQNPLIWSVRVLNTLSRAKCMYNVFSTSTFYPKQKFDKQIWLEMISVEARDENVYIFSFSRYISGVLQNRLIFS